MLVVKAVVLYSPEVKPNLMLQLNKFIYLDSLEAMECKIAGKEIKKKKKGVRNLPSIYALINKRSLQQIYVNYLFSFP